MLKFKLSSETFNSLFKRLLVSGSNDKSAKITFYLDKNNLEVFYTSTLEKGTTPVFFHEKIQCLESFGNGKVSLNTHNLFNIKVPEFTNELKYPQCREINFSFNTSVLEVVYDIFWSKDQKPNKTKLHFAILPDAEDLSIYDRLFATKQVIDDNSVWLDTRDLNSAIASTSFIKSDVTSKDSNGTLLRVVKDTLHVVSTDSSIAIQHLVNVTKPTKVKSFNVVISPIILSAIKSFIPADDEMLVAQLKNQLYLEYKDRKMLAPILASEYVIEEPENFFLTSSPLIASLDLKPIINLSNTIINNTTDIYKRLSLIFKSGSLNLATDLDTTEEVPTSNIYLDSILNLNGDYFLSSCNKILALSLTANLHYIEDDSIITLASPDGKIISLIRGLST